MREWSLVVFWTPACCEFGANCLLVSCFRKNEKCGSALASMITSSSKYKIAATSRSACGSLSPPRLARQRTPWHAEAINVLRVLCSSSRTVASFIWYLDLAKAVGPAIHRHRALSGAREAQIVEGMTQPELLTYPGT